MRLTKTLALILCLLAGASLTAAAADSGTERARKLPDLRDVRKIYVGDMGTADEAERFRFLLEEQLTKKAFRSSRAPKTPTPSSPARCPCACWTTARRHAPSSNSKPRRAVGSGRATSGTS